MIFKKLILKNFMSYSNAEIDFSSVHVACLVGANGAGKSSLLDAITWAIWEEGRARTDELIKLGADEMSCQVEFFMEDALYRIYRSRSKAFKNSQGKSNLEFQILNPKEQNWIPLTMSSTRQTQDLIIKTLKMDHETFVNSVYLRQGKADEFTLKRPNERKQILVDILGLRVYDSLCDASRIKVKELDQIMALEQGFISELKNKISKEEEIRVDLEKITQELNKEELELKKIKEALNKKEKELNEKKEREKQIQTLEKSRESQESLIQALEAQLKNIKVREDNYKQLINNKTQIQQDYSHYLELKEKFELIETEKELHNKLTHEKSFLEQDLQDKIKQTEQELAIYKSKMNERGDLRNKLLDKLKNEARFHNFLNRAENEIREFQNLQESLAEIETGGLELKHKKDLLLLDLRKLDEVRTEIIRKIETLSSHKSSETCPLCKSIIKDKEEVIEAYKSELKALLEKEELISKNIRLTEEELQNKRNNYNKTKERIASYEEAIIRHLKELEEIRQEKIDLNSLEKANKTKPVSFLESQLQVSRNEFQKTKEELVVLDKEISNYNAEINSLNNLLVSGTVVKEISEKLNNIVNQINNLKYNPDSYNELKKCLKEKENITLIYNSLKQAEAELYKLTSEIENLTSKITSGQKELEELKNLINENKKQIYNIDFLSKEVQEMKQTEHEKSLRFNDVKKQLIVKEQELLEAEKAKHLVKEKESKIKSFLNDKKYFEILETAFSKNGIQIAIIETIVPEIEKEANRILSRLTENQMHIALKTQREKKSTEGIVETLDVVIADNVGTRNYELYSGGEAFKINFSLRLALSRLLTNRAGAKLQTLIIDEGFGSQDSAGKERLVEVIKSIQNEFELILAVTHLDELKEAFPIQIQVEKDERGSTVRLFA